MDRSALLIFMNFEAKKRTTDVTYQVRPLTMTRISEQRDCSIDNHAVLKGVANSAAQIQ